MWPTRLDSFPLLLPEPRSWPFEVRQVATKSSSRRAPARPWEQAAVRTGERSSTAWPWLLAGGACGATGTIGRSRRRPAERDRRIVRGSSAQMMDWHGYRVRRVTFDESPRDGRPHIVLVHGFGGSIEYWRRIVPALTSAGYTVHAIDLLGLGLSEKPNIDYSIELWATQVVDFCSELEHGSKPDVVLVGNSFGSLISLVAARKMSQAKGIVMLNCAVGMNNKNMLKAPMDGLQKWFAGLVLSLVDFVFKSPVLDFLFSKYATADTVGPILESLYPTNPSAADAEIVSSFVTPAEDPGAVEVLRQIYTGDPGPTPMEIAEDPYFDSFPIKVVWGSQDGLTPITGGVGTYFTRLAKERDNVDFEIVAAGHIPHDENPEAVNKAVLGWLAQKPWQ
ncbi:yugF [Symbiodinium natans]|uniref:YugF protein n=1 Tax=Symbiodinium natans TaxID=878477 RepID=A0A812P7U9_9DINO|nr:yugF [Symbiodinium natans]